MNCELWIYILYYLHTLTWIYVGMYQVVQAANSQGYKVTK